MVFKSTTGDTNNEGKGKMIEKINASERLQLRLEELIFNHHYLPGDRLPSERDIMAKFNVGRGTVREAYRSLQQKGLIEIKHGGGAFVKEIDSSMVGETLATFIRHRQVPIGQFQEFREAIESRCAAYAAERATPAQIDQLKQLFNKLENKHQSVGTTDKKFYELELKLHTQVAKITGNPMFEWFASTFERNAAAYSDILANQSENLQEAMQDWRDFIQAIENREVTKAAIIMGSHIFRFKKVLEDLDQDNND